MKLDKIYESYKQYKEDMKIDIEMPDILPLPRFKDDNEASINFVAPDLVELFLGEVFFNGANAKYLKAILYHEFTHILDRKSYLLNIANENKHRNLLFPYSEFHAEQISLMYQLGLLYNPEKIIRKSSALYDEKGIITLEQLLKLHMKEYELYLEQFKENPSLKNLQYLIYIYIYNIGRYFVCRPYNIPEELFINISKDFPNQKLNFEKVKELLTSNLPSDELCISTHEVINEIMNSIIEEYNLNLSK